VKSRINQPEVMVLMVAEEASAVISDLLGDFDVVMKSNV
jgi:hypothetical protein